MTLICGRGSAVLVLLLIVALMITSSHGLRPLLLDVEKEGFPLPTRDEMVRMAGYGEEKLSTVLITGLVLCNRACPIKPSHQLPQLPISGAVVAVTCQNKTTEEGAKAVTDKYGEFILDLPSQLHAIENLDKACSVEVLHLPKNSPCRQAAFTGTHKGIKLASSEDATRTFAAGSITFRATMRKNSKACMKGMGHDQRMSW